MNNPQAELFAFVLEKLEAEPPARRARLLRALAEYAGHPKATAELHSLANTIEATEARYQEFAFQFRNGGRR
jgi:hypothetical protein